MSRPSRAPGAPVLFLGIVLGVVIVVTLIESLGGNPTVLLHFGLEYPDPRVNAYALEHLGDDVVYVNSIGHDGKWAFITAMDPLLLDPDTHARLMDHPAYRAQRVLLPVLAAPARVLGGPPALAWSLQVVQAVGIALGVWASARLAQALGISRWWCLLFVVNPGVWLELAITGPGVLASALLLWGLAMTTDDRPVLAGWLFALSLLSRESMLVAVIAVGIWSWRSRGLRHAARLLLPPAVVASMWWGYVWWRTGLAPMAGGETSLTLPFAGVFDAARTWASDAGIDLVVGAIGLGLIATALVQGVRRPSPTSWASAALALLALCLTAPSWWNWYDLLRVLLVPSITVPLLAVSARATRGGAGSSPSPSMDVERSRGS